MTTEIVATAVQGFVLKIEQVVQVQCGGSLIKSDVMKISHIDEKGRLIKSMRVPEECNCSDADQKVACKKGWIKLDNQIRDQKDPCSIPVCNQCIKGT